MSVANLNSRLDSINHNLNRLLPHLKKVTPSNPVDTLITTSDVISNRDVFDIVHSINVLAMQNTDLLDIYTRFNPVAKEFEVRAFADTVTHKEAMVYFQAIPISDDALPKLLEAESDLTEIIIAAREAAQG
ncbi:hypothetical protein [Vibrio quintilis]|uniref:Uncharacterized protein n=1 Tax=Vibrio quintilis TaxID=1117707 RepID=A0A1M7YYZ2_9VIBR|nr:hypothetical protein [Vibrio quintilis]SHO57861.1 hypothetical protein VQ7734_03631 [Vibrio quintilis]